MHLAQTAERATIAYVRTVDGDGVVLVVRCFEASAEVHYTNVVKILVADFPLFHKL